MGDRRRKTALFEQFARVGKALAVGKRLELLDLLAQGERAVDALAAAAGLEPDHRVGAPADPAAGRPGRHPPRRHADPLPAGRRRRRRPVRTRAARGRRRAPARRRSRPRRLPRRRRRPSRSTATSCCAGPRPARSTVLDVRPAEEYAAGHIPGAVTIPLDELRRPARRAARRRARSSPTAAAPTACSPTTPCGCCTPRPQRGPADRRDARVAIGRTTPHRLASRARSRLDGARAQQCRLALRPVEPTSQHGHLALDALRHPSRHMHHQPRVHPLQGSTRAPGVGLRVCWASSDRPVAISPRNISEVPGSGSAHRSSNSVRAWSASGTPRAAPGQSMTPTRSAPTSTIARVVVAVAEPIARRQPVQDLQARIGATAAAGWHRQCGRPAPRAGRAGSRVPEHRGLQGARWRAYGPGCAPATAGAATASSMSAPSSRSSTRPGRPSQSTTSISSGRCRDRPARPGPPPHAVPAVAGPVDLDDRVRAPRVHLRLPARPQQGAQRASWSRGHGRSLGGMVTVMDAFVWCGPDGYCGDRSRFAFWLRLHKLGGLGDLLGRRHKRPRLGGAAPWQSAPARRRRAHQHPTGARQAVARSGVSGQPDVAAEPVPTRGTRTVRIGDERLGERA